MKRLQIFPMTSGAWIGSICFVLGVSFVFYFFLAPSPPVYEKIRTEIGEVVAILPASRSEYLNNEEEVSVTVSFNDGGLIYMNVPKKQKIKIGQFIEVDTLESDREKLIYRLAQESVQP